MSRLSSLWPGRKGGDISDMLLCGSRNATHKNLLDSTGRPRASWPNPDTVGRVSRHMQISVVTVFQNTVTVETRLLPMRAHANHSMQVASKGIDRRYKSTDQPWAYPGDDRRNVCMPMYSWPSHEPALAPWIGSDRSAPCSP